MKKNTVISIRFGSVLGHRNLRGENCQEERKRIQNSRQGDQVVVMTIINVHVFLGRDRERHLLY